MVVFVSGCTSTAGTETVIFDQNVSGGQVALSQYVNVPNNAKIRVEISNVTTTSSNLNFIGFYGLNIEGQKGQAVSNYQSNIVDMKTFENISSGFSGNNTFNSGLKSIGMTFLNTKANVKIVAIS